MIFNHVTFIIIAYLFGSIPSGLIIGKLFRNIDIRNHGSGNLGATNAMRVLGKKLGFLVGIMDVLKGGFIIIIARLLIDMDFITINALVFGVFAVIGHIYPLFANFKGGKAVATTGGILLFYQPFIALIAAIVLIVTIYLTRYVSLGSTLGAYTLLIMSLFIDPLRNALPNLIFDDQYQSITIAGFSIKIIVIVTILTTAFIMLRHISNYKRIIKGTEAKVGQK